MQSMPSWPLFAALVVVGAVLLVLFLKSRPSAMGEVRLKPGAAQTPRSVRARGRVLRRKPSRGTTMFEGMEVAEFEAQVSGLLRELGYAVRPAPQSGLHDVNLLLEATNRRVAVQLKRWKAPVGDRSVYALFTGRIHYATDEAWLITTSKFTRKALKLAETTGVRLVDGAQLAEWLSSREEPFPALPEIDPGSPTRPSRSPPGSSEGPGDAVADALVQEESNEGTQETPLGRA